MKKGRDAGRIRCPQFADHLPNQLFHQLREVQQFRTEPNFDNPTPDNPRVQQDDLRENELFPPAYNSVEFMRNLQIPFPFYPTAPCPDTALAPSWLYTMRYPVTIFMEDDYTKQFPKVPESDFTFRHHIRILRVTPRSYIDKERVEHHLLDDKRQFNRRKVSAEDIADRANHVGLMTRLSVPQFLEVKN